MCDYERGISMLGNIDKLNDIFRDRGYDFTIKSQTVVKNNCQMEGLVICGDSFSAYPVYYPDDEFISSDEDDQVRIIKQIRDDYAADIDIGMVMNRDYILDNVYPRLVSETNLDMVRDADIVYRPFLDMLIEYYVVIPSPQDGAYTSYTIRGSHLVMNDLYENDIFHKSLVNLVKQIVIIPINRILAKYTDETELPEMEIYVLTNKSQLFGASVILLDVLLQEVGQILGEPYIIFPSSIHECIAVGFNYSLDLNEALAMVKEINENSVSIEDRLTNSVYICENGFLSVFNGSNRN